MSTIIGNGVSIRGGTRANAKIASILNEDGTQNLIITDSGTVLDLESLTSDATATEEDVANGKTFYTNGIKKTGTSSASDPVLLWTNPDPTKEFAAQTITVTEYPTYIIHYRSHHYTGINITNRDVPVWSYLNSKMSGVAVTYPYTGSSSGNASRTATYTNGNITFSAGSGVNSPNYYMIPEEIYGCSFNLE